MRKAFLIRQLAVGPWDGRRDARAAPDQRPGSGLSPLRCLAGRSVRAADQSPRPSDGPPGVRDEETRLADREVDSLANLPERFRGDLASPVAADFLMPGDAGSLAEARAVHFAAPGTMSRLPFAVLR